MLINFNKIKLASIYVHVRWCRNIVHLKSSSLESLLPSIKLNVNWHIEKKISNIHKPRTEFKIPYNYYDYCKLCVLQHIRN